MSALINYDRAITLSYPDIEALGPAITSRADARGRLLRLWAGQASTGHLIGHDGRGVDRSNLEDAVESFLTSTLEQLLTSITRGSNSPLYMMPGAASKQLLPVRSTLRPGQTSIVYDVETTSGQAVWVAPSGARKLPQVGESAERKKHETDWLGIGWGWGLVEMWQAAERGGNLDQSRAQTASRILAEAGDKVLLWGDVGHKQQGLITHPSAVRVLLATKFASITDPTDAIKQLQIMEQAYKRANAGRMPTGVVLPAGDWAALQRLRYTDSAGGFVLPHLLEQFPWLSQAERIDGIATAGVDDGPVWILWADDANELWSEVSTPMVFGPWTDGLQTSFATIMHIGGVINRRVERLMRFEFPA